jgi:hypothetical protein
MFERILNTRRVDQESEFAELQAEAKRRQRELEGIPDSPNMLGRYKVGSHKMSGGGLPMAEALEAAAADQGFAHYVESPEDQKALDRELSDLYRDANAMSRSEGVRFDEANGITPFADLQRKVDSVDWSEHE